MVKILTTKKELVEMLKKYKRSNPDEFEEILSEKIEDEMNEKFNRLIDKEINKNPKLKKIRKEGYDLDTGFLYDYPQVEDMFESIKLKDDGTLIMKIRFKWVKEDEDAPTWEKGLQRTVILTIAYKMTKEELKSFL